MRVLGALLLAAVVFGATLFFMSGGFNRFRSAPTTRNVASGDPTLSQPLPPRPAETDPALLLFKAIELQDEDEALKMLAAHPELADKEVSNAPFLWRARAWGSLPVVKSMVEKGAKLEARNYQNRTALWPAVFNKHDDVVKYLIEKGASVKTPQDDGETLLWAAHSREMAELLIKAGVDPRHKNIKNDTALHKACRNCLPDVVKVLLDAGVDVEAVGNWNMRPIHCVASSISGDGVPVLKVLLERGADINSKGFAGQSALHECILTIRTENAALLLKRGADPNALNDKKETPLDFIGSSGISDRIEIYNLLVRHDARTGDGRQGLIIPKKN